MTKRIDAAVRAANQAFMDELFSGRAVVGTGKAEIKNVNFDVAMRAAVLAALTAIQSTGDETDGPR